jgi:hypothetical protein
METPKKQLIGPQTLFTTNAPFFQIFDISKPFLTISIIALEPIKNEKEIIR